MADVLLKPDLPVYTGVGRLLDRLCKAFAIAAGIVLVLMALLSLASITGRSLFQKALVGDFELVQILSAVAVAMTLPYAHWAGAHVIVDFFTMKAPVKANALMDMLSNLLIAVVAGVIGWRTVVGLLDLRSNFDASMMLNIPTWWSYAAIAPSFMLLCATALFGAWVNFGKLRT